MLFCIGDESFPGVEIPFAPRRNDLDVRVKRIGIQLETNLVVAFARGTVRYRVGTRFLSDPHQMSGYQRTGDRCSQ